MNATTEIHSPYSGRLSGSLRTRKVLDGGDEPTEPLPVGISPHEHTSHRLGDGVTTLADLLGDRWEPHPWAHGRHTQPMQGRGWVAAIVLVIAGLMLLAILAPSLYEQPQDAGTPMHGVPVPATTGQTPEPPAAGRGAR